MSDKACIYVADPTLVGSKLFDQIEAIKDWRGTGSDDKAKGVEFDLGSASIRCTFMQGKELARHLEDFEDFIREALEDDSDGRLYAIARARQIRLAIGCVVEPDFDQDEVGMDFIMEFTTRVRGMLFVGSLLIDYDGEPLIGTLNDEEE
ncbi:MAG: hypothetical protein ACYTKD_22075 [Planctomycetota bacterium]|jgi:hypothetical protein